MSPELRIIHDLQHGQSSASAVAERVRIPVHAVEVILKRMATEGRVTVLTVAEVITVYRLNPELL